MTTLEETRTTTLRQPTLATLGLPSPLEILRSGRLPFSAAEAVERVFGPEGSRGALVISGANGIVGAGKTMQLGSRLVPFGVPVVALDLPGAPDGIGRQYPGLVRAFGRAEADRIMAGIVRLAYDGKSLPPRLAELSPRFLLEAVPEVLEIKRAHYALFREALPGIEIRSVTSGFPAAELGVPVAHPAFPHEINKVWETVELAEGSEIPRLLWALGLVPMPMADRWSFVLDVVFCGITLAGLRYHRATNTPFWKVDKLVRRLLGPNPFRAHDAIGAKGANFLTWSCLHHLAEHYGELFRPTPELAERKETGQDWYPPNHFRPVVGWSLDGDGEDALAAWLLGPLVQMTALMLHEERAHPASLNAIGELCAQLRRGVLATLRDLGPDRARELVERYHRRHPEAARSPWHPETLGRLEEPALQQLYVNAEHDGTVGVVTLGREAYNWDVDAELNRALDWLRSEGIERVVLCGDFHLAGQHVGADTAEFFPALESEEEGFRVSASWSRTARRLHEGFRISVALIHGKRCLGGMLELMLHCHHVVAVDGASLGFPEVTLPVVPGMEGCHWPFRKARPEDWRKLLGLLLDGRPVPAGHTVGWLVDRAAPLEEALGIAWGLASGSVAAEPRHVATGTLEAVHDALPTLAPTGNPSGDQAREAICEAVLAACEAPLGEALEIQSRHSAGFMTGAACRKGVVGQAARRTLEG
jgi:enoyl-CoA hydratase/carnithine racemase